MIRTSPTSEPEPAPVRALAARLAPREPRTFRGLRAIQIAARSVHIAAMALVLGGVAWRAPEEALQGSVALTIASGLLLLGLDLWKSGRYFVQGNGLAVLLKLGLLGLGLLLPGARLAWYLAATAVASIGSHMPKSWRHWSPLDRRVA
ncbi:MAG TPA: hypothetical protein VMS88_00315 [Terriglobales bacterium]|nr:hypothetical protein [Terriglobales bacterium]